MEKVSWENAHAKIGNYYQKHGKANKFLEEYNVLINDKPFDKYPYLCAIRIVENEIELLKLLS